MIIQLLFLLKLVFFLKINVFNKSKGSLKIFEIYFLKLYSSFKLILFYFSIDEFINSYYYYFNASGSSYCRIFYPFLEAK